MTTLTLPRGALLALVIGAAAWSGAGLAGSPPATSAPKAPAAPTGTTLVPAPATDPAVIAALVGYHDALTKNDPAAVEAFVLADSRFVMIEGKHMNVGWADYRDNHLKGELADLAKVRFKLDDYRMQVDGDLAYASFTFHIVPKTGPEKDFGKGHATAVLVKTPGGWKLRHLHTS